MRTTIYLDEELRDRLDQLVPSRGLSRFVNEAIAEKVKALEAQRVKEEMKEGYIATRNDRAQANADWSAVDADPWPN